MADAPSISRIVGLLSEHPEIIGQITALLGNEEAEPAADGPSEASEATEASVSEVHIPERRRSDRARLLGAMKPYLSESRSRAVETMITVSEILDSMRGGG